MNLSKSLPVITSILIILVVAFLRDRSRTLAAVLATMPINVPLALWIVASSTGSEGRELTAFVRALLISIVPSVIWLAVVFFGLRAGWSLLVSIGAGYGVWAALIAALVLTGGLTLAQ